MDKLRSRVFATVAFREGFGNADGSGEVSAVQLMRCGTFEHGWYGKIRIDRELYDALIRNFEGRVRGIDIALDVEHQPEKGAAGWFRRVFVGEIGEELWGEIEWTARGRELVEGGIFKYLSIEYDLAYVDEEGALHGPTMLGAALTNRPFLKRMKAATVNLSDGVWELGGDGVGELGSEGAGELGGLGEGVRELSDGERVLMSEVARLRDETARLRDEMRRLEISQALNEAKRQGKVTPAMENWLTELAGKDEGVFQRVLSVLPAQVNFSEIGSSVSDEGSDPETALDAAVRSKMRQLHEGMASDSEPLREITYGEALAAVQREQPGLAAAYQSAVRGRQ